MTLIWISCEQPAIKMIVSQLVQKSQTCGSFSLGLWVFNPPPHFLFHCCEGEKQVLSDRGTLSSAIWETDLSGHRSVFFLVFAIEMQQLPLPFLLPEVHVEPHKKQLHVTLAYHFHASHLPTLEKLAQNIDVKLGCDWVATIFSRDIRFANHEVTSHWGS